MKVRIEIDTRTFVRFWLVVIGFALAALLIYSARTALVIIGIAFFLALALNRPVVALAKRLPGKSRVGATALAFVAVVAFLGLFTFLVVPPIVQQTVKFAETVPQLIDQASDRWAGIDPLIDQYNLREQVDNAVASAKNNATKWAANIGTNILSGIGSIFSVLAATFLVLVLSFLMLIEAPTWLRRLWSVYTDTKRRESHKAVVHRMYGVVTGYVTGQLTVAGIGALATGLAVFVLSFIFPIDANLAMPAMALAFVLSLVPMFGATIAGVLITALLALNSVPAAIVFAVYFIVYQQVENNFISPVIQSKTVELSALVVLVAVTIGLYMFGLAGGIISIPIAGCIKVLIEEYLDRREVKSAKQPQSQIKNLVKKLQKEKTA